MDAAIEIAGLVVDRGGRRVLHGLDLTAATGAVIGVLGPSGSGKTTMLRSVVGVQRVRAGTVTVLGHPAGSRPLRSRIGYMTQAPSIYGDLTVIENVRYFASLYRLGTSAVAEAIDAVGLADHAQRVTRTLSGGQHSRASLACAIVARPDLLVLDEPTVGQDPLLRDELWAYFHDLAAGGTTILVSSHVMDEANRCDELVLIREGVLLHTGTPAGLKAEAGCADLDEAFLTLVRRNEAA
ncbi:ABC transporter ATP-binding protein [Ruania albidiflava]|uniref:ABC transporter ATP-binding protein n=1 Tax=Ruania albidiflava TaxID=366586 RepID=UPI0003B490D4|nr:ABC transporter ATP-binding protein [Ruania albidiflava]